MLLLLKWAIDEGLVLYETEYFEKIGFSRQAIHKVRTGLQSFTKEQIIEACKLTGANANWILGLEPNMHRKPPKTPLMLLQEAYIAVSQELGGKRR